MVLRCYGQQSRNTGMHDDDSQDSMPQDALAVLDSTVRVLDRHIADMLHLSARVEGLELMVVALGAKLGWPQDHVISTLRKAQNTLHQKRLERVEDLNPAAAAAADSRREVPEIDEILLNMLKYDEEGGNAVDS